jgi:hypothetical protein
VRIELREDNWWPVADDLNRVLSTSTVNGGSFTWKSLTPDWRAVTTTGSFEVGDQLNEAVSGS